MMTLQRIDGIKTTGRVAVEREIESSGDNDVIPTALGRD